MIKTYSELPTTCEFCGSSLYWDDNHVNLVCTNPNCMNASESRIKAFITNISPVDGLGWKTIKKLLSETEITTIDDLFHTTFRFDTDKPTSEKGLFNLMLNQLQSDDYKISISQFVLALNIEGIGKIGANNMENNKDLFNRAMRIMIADVIYNSNYDEKLIKTEDLLFMLNYLSEVFGDRNAAKRFYHDNRPYVVFCYNLVKNKLEVDNTTNNVEVRGHVVLTGRLSIKRSDYVVLLEKQGWFVDDKVNEHTTYLITNDTNSNTAKAKDAKKYNTKIVTEEEFNKKFNIIKEGE